MLSRLLSPFQRLVVSDDHPHRIDIAVLLVIGGAAFYYLALITFYPFDDSWLAVARPPASPQNGGGRVGSYLSSFAFYHLGVAAYSVPLPALLFLGLRYIAQRQLAWASFGLGALSFIMATGLALARFLPLILVSGLPFQGGGVWGLSLLRRAEVAFGAHGSVIVGLTLGLVSLILMFKKSLLYQGLFPVLRRLAGPLARASAGLTTAVNDRLARFFALPLHMSRYLRRRWSARRPHAAGSTAAIGHTDALALRREPLVASPDLNPTPSTTGASATQPVQDSSWRQNLGPLANMFQASADEHESRPPDLDSLRATQEELLAALHDFKITGTVIDFQRGPLVTTYAFKPEKGIKQATVIGLINDLALALKLDSLFVHPIPEKSALGFQIPNRQRETVRFADFIHSAAMTNSSAALPLALGKNIYGEVVADDLSQMPHLLIAGSTGSGKSVGIHSFICSLLAGVAPAKLRLLLVDPKMLELTYYEGLPQLLRPVITDPDAALDALAAAIREMELRYKIMQAAKVRHIADFNDFWQRASSEQRFNLLRTTGLDSIDFMPYQVIVIDELADLMMTAAKDLESMIARLAQKARASGIHMILATQRPSVDVITGTIKANFPSRLSYRLVSSHDSRTIIDQPGAEKLLGRGDLLFHKPGASRLIRLHSPFITDAEIKAVVAHFRGPSSSSSSSSFSDAGQPS